MPLNIEIKARIDSIAAMVPRVEAIADQGPVEIAQDDTFFACSSGRLKLRAFADGSGELIFYQRADHAGPKASFYVRSATREPDSLRDALRLAYGITGRVVKERTLYLAGRTRIHLDRVRDLGEFIELEVVLADGEDEATGLAEADTLIARLGIEPARLVHVAYVDLLSRRP